MTATLTSQTENSIDIQHVLDDAARELARITERTEFALSVVTQAVRTQEAIAKGKVLIALKELVPDGMWSKFLQREDVNLTHSVACRYINCAKMVEDAAPLYGEEMLLNFGTETLNLISNLPPEYQVEVLDKAEQDGKPVSQYEVAELNKTPEVKLSKAAEKLAEAKARKEALSAAGNHDAAWHQQKTVDSLEARILQLESELKREQEQKHEISEDLTSKEDSLAIAERKLEAATKELDAAVEEAHALRFDADTARQQRINRVGNNLILTLPQVLSDLQKFVAEQEFYSEKVQKSVTTQINTLTSYLQEHFTHASEDPIC